MPQVSVIIPTYNREALLSDAITSVLKQTYTGFELIIIDDGSNDKTRDVVEAFTDKRLTYYYQDNKGVSAARNWGIHNARSDLICFLDSDDYWLPQKLAVQITFIKQHPSILINQTDEIWIRRGKRVNPLKKHTKYAGMIYEKCLPLCLITPSSVMIKRELFNEVGLFDEKLSACEDYDLWLRITYRYSVGLTRKKLIVKRGGHENQLSRTIPSLDRFRIQALLNIVESNALSSTQRTATIKELKKKCTIYGNGCIKRGKSTEGNSYLSLYKKYTA